MRTINILSLAAIAFVTSCNTESGETSLYSFDRKAGSEIPISLAEQWLTGNANADGRNDQPFSVTPETYQLVLQTPDQAGVALQYAIDENDDLHVLLVPVGDNRVLYDAPSKIVDANTNTIIANEQAKSWSAKFNELNPGQTWYHFFGVDIMSEINNKSFSRIDIKPAFDDEGAPQLLLYVWQNSPTGRVADAQDLTVYDRSNPCPCPK